MYVVIEKYYAFVKLYVTGSEMKKNVHNASLFKDNPRYPDFMFIGKDCR